MGKAKRYNKGKIRYELIAPHALKLIADVYTKGAHKYSMYKDKDGKTVSGKDIPFETVGDYELIEDGSDNWRLGQNWMGSLDSVERHIADFKSGKDFDELGTYTIANAAWGLMSILEYYKIFPQGDDRTHSYLNMPKIGLDIDNVLADFSGYWCKHHGQEVPETWNFDRNISEKFDSLKDDKDFWLNIPVLTKPNDVKFEPSCYITSRSIPIEWTIEWLDKNGFPTMPVYSIGHDQSKVEVAKKSGIEIMVDDRFENFVELNNAGICCYLFDAPHNRRYSVGHKRLYKISDLFN